MEGLSRAAVQLFHRDVPAADMRRTLDWSHNFFNVMLGGDPVQRFWPEILAEVAPRVAPDAPDG
jgi:hypothetical protein